MPMPHIPHRVRSATETTPVPVAVLLPPPGEHPRRSGSGGLSPHAARQLVAVYTRPGDLVLDLDADPGLAGAAGWLDRRHLAVTDPSDRPGAGSARLVVARLPRPGAIRLSDSAQWMRRARARLAVGGHLLAVLTPANGDLDHPTTVIAAARAAGLFYRDQIIDVQEPLPEWEPCAEPATAAATAPRLAGGRHRQIHRELYAFGAGGVDA